MCDFHIFIAIFDDISPFHHFDHFFVNFFSCGVWGGCGGVAGLHRKVFVSISYIVVEFDDLTTARQAHNRKNNFKL